MRAILSWNSRKTECGARSFPFSLAERAAPFALLALLLGAPTWAEAQVGLWKMNPGHSIFPSGSQPRSLTVRIELHANGEVFTVDKIERDGRAVSDSTILYLDGKPRAFDEPGCSGTQSSQRLDSQTVEVQRRCASGAWTRFIRRLNTHRELVLEITSQQPDGRQVEHRLLLEKTVGGSMK